jgi:hypothetical protein
VLAYLLWHTPTGADTAAYERGLGAFHRALAATPPAGFVTSWTLRVDQPSWLPAGPAHYVDWYVVESYTALGELNDDAVSGARRAPHDVVATLVRTGTAGLVGFVGGDPAGPGAPEVGRPGLLGLLDKPPGQSYNAFRPALTTATAGAPGATCWMRQMTLGPGPEFMVLAAGTLPALPAPVTALDAAVVATA